MFTNIPLMNHTKCERWLWWPRSSWLVWKLRGWSLWLDSTSYQSGGQRGQRKRWLDCCWVYLLWETQLFWSGQESSRDIRGCQHEEWRWVDFWCVLLHIYKINTYIRSKGIGASLEIPNAHLLVNPIVVAWGEKPCWQIKPLIGLNSSTCYVQC